MRILCPACAAAYEVPISLLKPGQAVRCARCGKEWTPDLEPEASAAPPEPPPLPSSPSMEGDRIALRPPSDAASGPPSRPTPRPTSRPTVLRHTPAPPGARAGLSLAWAGSILALGVLLALAYSERAAVMQAWPPSARVYAALGLTGGH